MRSGGIVGDRQIYLFLQGWTAAADAEENEIRLDADATIKLNCDETNKRKCKATQKRVREDSGGDRQGHGLC